MNGSATARTDLGVTSRDAAGDPLRAVQHLGRRASRDGIYIGLIVAFLSHFGAFAAPEYTMWQMRGVVDRMQTELHGHFIAAYDVEVLDEDEDEPPADDQEELIADEEEEEVDEEAQVEPEPLVQDDAEAPEETDESEAPEDDNLYPDEEDAAPDIAEAADVMTAPEDGPVDLTDRYTFVDKDGSDATGAGYSGAKGKARHAVRNPNARPGGKGRRNSKGKGKGRKKRQRRKVDRSRGLSGQYNTSCPFPPQADLHQVDKATVMLSVTVSAAGRVLDAHVVSDPGYGFGAAAKRCIMAMSFPAALDESGNPITKTGTVPFRFSR